MAFSLTDRKSFEAVDSWLSKVEDEIGDGIPTALVINKMDLAGSGYRWYFAQLVEHDQKDDGDNKKNIFDRTKVLKGVIAEGVGLSEQ